MIAPRQPEYVALMPPACGSVPSFSNVNLFPTFLSVSITRCTWRSPGRQHSTYVRSRQMPSGSIVSFLRKARSPSSMIFFITPFTVSAP